MPDPANSLREIARAWIEDGIDLLQQLDRIRP